MGKPLLEKQKTVRTHIENHFENFKKSGADNMTYEYAETRLKRLEALWEKYQSHDAELQALTPEAKLEIDPNQVYFNDETLYEVEDQYDQKKALYVTFMRINAPEVLPPSPHTMLQSTVLQDSQDVSGLLKSLPQITIEKFSGASSEWPHFRDLFKSLIDSQKMASVIKLTLLKTYLTGEALTVIKSIPITEENYVKAWEALVDHFENERRLVNHHLSELFAAKPMNQESYSEVKRVLSEIQAPLDALKSIGRSTDQWSDIIVFMIAKNLHKNIRREWEKNQGNCTKAPSLERIKTFLQNQITVLEAVERASKLSPFPTPSATTPQSSKKQGQGSSNTSLNTSLGNQNKESQKKNKLSCILCKEEHHVSKCAKFIAKSDEERRALVNQKRLCFNCSGHHQIKDCKSTYKCFTCKGRHHTALHPSESPTSGLGSLDQKDQTPSTFVTSQLPAGQDSSVTNANLTAHATSYNGRTGVLLGTARIIIEGPDGRKIKVRALIDNCSQPSFVSERVTKKLELPGESIHAPILAVGGVPAVTGKQSTIFKIRPHFNSRYSCEVKALVVPRVCSYTPPQSQMASSLLYLSHINLADPTFLDTDDIDVLLGADIHAKIIQGGIIRGNPEEPITMSSKLGWLISGSVPLTAHVTAMTCHHSAVDSTSDLSESLEKFWRVEELPAVKYLTPDEEKCEKHFAENLQRDDTGRYVVRLPFKTPEGPRLGDSYRKAVIMLKRMEEKFESDHQFKKLYHDFIKDYISSGHMIPVTRDSPLFKPQEECFFLPHHGVLKPSSSTTKLRTVFNGSSKTNLNLSLNSQLHTGPNLLPELPDLMCMWRMYKHAFVADIKQMFRQIRLDDRDLHYQAIVWRFQPNDPIQVYYLTTVTYGLVSSPFQATRTLRQLATDYQFTAPLAAAVLNKECYMDDMLSGDHSLEQALEKQAQLIRTLKEGGFELRKWLSNDPRILSHLPADHLADEQATIFDDSTPFSILGLNWHAKDDLFRFRVNVTQDDNVQTKRTVLSEIAKIFDPMGWIAPVIISAKIFMQSLWLLKCDWDDPLPLEYLEQWTAWTALLDSINLITIPRFVFFSPNATICEVHGFSDASERAYSAVIYLRIVQKGEVSCSLQLAKTKVAPLKTVSVQKLELLGAHTLAKLTSHYCSAISIEVSSIHLWSDSKDVLFWLRSHPSRWKTFVANRCSDIHSATPNAFWHHIAGSDNPADVASRGLNPDLLKDHPLWWQGPPFLKKSSDPWSTIPEDLLDHKPIEERTIRLKLVANAATQAQSPEEKIWDLCFRFSCLSKLLRVTAYILRLIFKLSKKLVKNQLVNSFKLPEFLDFTDIDAQFISPKELRNSKFFWIYQIQQAYFKKEILALQNSENRSKVKLPGALRQLRPIVKDGFLLVGGRINQSLLAYEQKHPFILPGDCFLSQLIIRAAHALVLHGGVQTTLGAVRQNYWIINGRNMVKKIIRECKPCIRFGSRPQNQIMGDLPRDRVQPTPQFRHSGVDYAGPFSIRLTKTRGNVTKKGWICLFICLSTRAFHLEFVEDYTSESFIAAFHRFTSRRGYVSKLYCDQGSNFIGAEAELRKMMRGSSPYIFEVQKGLSSQGVKWVFNPPGAPHFGGLWEAGVKSTKHHLRRVIGQSVLTFSEMDTLLCRIEACLNSRPLLPLTDDPSDLNYLTPSHMIIHQPSYLIPEPDFTSVKVSLARRWQIISQKVQNFWSRWRREYLSAMQPRVKWQKSVRSFQPGDVVFIRHENTPPGHWPLARVVMTYPDQYGDNRYCDVVYKKPPYLKKKARLLQRPSVKLVLLVPAELGQKPTPTTVETSACDLVLLQAAQEND